MIGQRVVAQTLDGELIDCGTCVDLDTDNNEWTITTQKYFDPEAALVAGKASL